QVLAQGEQPPGEHAQTARGVVFHDANENGKLDASDKPLAGMRVSNGRDIVETNANGGYELPVSDDTILFVIKPRGWRTPISGDMLPRFYYIHKPNGSPADFKYAGVAPTGPLPASVDFPLYPQAEPDKFRAVMFGDPQPSTQEEVDFVAHDVIEELVGTDAKFGVTLGDIMFDDLALFDSQNGAIAVLGIPWY
ncbi:MAG: metallophosphoesterase, partial [Planctomycetales bacterium]|nr:metallophosphoesterase [Planctomycetales bacterium]